MAQAKAIFLAKVEDEYRVAEAYEPELLQSKDWRARVRGSEPVRNGCGAYETFPFFATAFAKARELQEASERGRRKVPIIEVVLERYDARIKATHE